MKVAVIGTIDESHKEVSGQYDRTEIIVEGLRNKGYDVRFTNMMYWRQNPIGLFFKIVLNYFRSNVFIFVASLNGVRINLNLLRWLEMIKVKPAFQIAIGGKSNCNFIREEEKYRKMVQKLNGVFVEIESMVEEYNDAGIDRVYYMPNCKNVDMISLRFKPLMMKPYRFCTYSRVTPEKGIKEAIEAVERLNEKYGKDYCTLDIYGTYLPESRAWFEQLMDKSSNAITYKAKIERKDSIEVLSKYDMMLFPTRHGGEGVPGAMIDCYEAGLPIVVCNTSYMAKIVVDGVSGFVYDGDDNPNLDNAILRYTEELSIDGKRKMRDKCMEMALDYDTSAAITVLLDQLQINNN